MNYRIHWYLAHVCQGIALLYFKFKRLRRMHLGMSNWDCSDQTEQMNFKTLLTHLHAEYQHRARRCVVVYVRDRYGERGGCRILTTLFHRLYDKHVGSGGLSVEGRSHVHAPRGRVQRELAARVTGQNGVGPVSVRVNVAVDVCCRH